MSLFLNDKLVQKQNRGRVVNAFQDGDTVSVMMPNVIVPDDSQGASESSSTPEQGGINMDNVEDSESSEEETTETDEEQDAP